MILSLIGMCTFFLRVLSFSYYLSSINKFNVHFFHIEHKTHLEFYQSNWKFVLLIHFIRNSYAKKSNIIIIMYCGPNDENLEFHYFTIQILTWHSIFLKISENNNDNNCKIVDVFNRYLASLAFPMKY